MNNFPARYFKYRGINICDRPPYVLKDIVDISSGTATREETTYYGFDGCKYTNILYERRAFQVTGTIITDNYFDFVQAQRRLIAAADMKTEADAEYFNRKDSYFAKCYFLALPSFTKRLAWTCEFTLELAIPSFYWLSLKKSTDIQYNTLVENFGDVETYPAFEITKSTYSQPEGIRLELGGGSEYVAVNYAPAAGETVVIDTFNADVYKTYLSGGVEVRASLLNVTDLSSTFFSLAPGKNRVTANGAFTAGSESFNIVTCRHYDRFLGV